MSDNSIDGAHERRATHLEPTEPAAVVPPLTPPAGWYPDPQDPAAQRYWDGAQWTTHTAGTAPFGAATPGTPAADAGAETLPGGAVAVKRGLPKLKWWQWTLIAIAAIVLVSMVVNGVNGQRASSDAAAPKPTAAVEQANEPVAAEKPVEMVEVPQLVGSTVAEARAKLDAVGLRLAPGDAADDWVVVTQQPTAGSHPLEGLELSVTSEAPKPVYTLAQQNAIAKAQSYLKLMGFSRTGLIEQLEFEGYSAEDATFGADNAGADWLAEAAEKAKSYLDMMAFSREGLYDQLAYEGFTDAEIQHGLTAVGY
ncbi:Ltp family lipoprotein [Microbacterium sp. NPDC055357]